MMAAVAMQTPEVLVNPQDQAIQSCPYTKQEQTDDQTDKKDRDREPQLQSNGEFRSPTKGKMV